MANLNAAWLHLGPSLTAAFLASLVEFVEALTVILAVGSVRGWRDTLAGAAAALVLLGLLTASFGTALARVPLGLLRLGVGALLLLFGLRWLRKAILRAAGVVPLHDEAAQFSAQVSAMRQAGRATQWDRIAFLGAFQIMLLEGSEVVFIVIAVGASGGLLLPAGLAALAALLVVVLIGLLLRQPLANVPENAMKFVVGGVLSAFGCFWAGEGMGVTWPGGNSSIFSLNTGFLVVAGVAVPACQCGARRRTGAAAA